jgi:hypothetical protein
MTARLREPRRVFFGACALANAALANAALANAGPANAALASAALACLAGCGGTERAVSLTVDVEASGDRLCVGASHPRLEAPVRFGYALSTLAPPFTLTFVAGEDVRDEIQLSGWTLEAMRTRGRGASSVVFPDRGATRATIQLRTCVFHPPRRRGARPGGTFAQLRSPPHILAGDLDADGRDELLAIGEDGSLQVLDAEDPSEGSTRRTELATLDGEVSDVADLDGDCAFEIAAAASTGALVVDGATGNSPAPVGPSARQVRMGAFGGGGAAGLLVASEAGLLSLPWPVGVAETLARDPIASLDVRAEAGLTRVVASGSTGTRWLRTVGGAVRDETERLARELATATGPAVVADLDGAGGIDLVVAEGSVLRFGVADGSSVRFEAGPDLGVAIDRLLATDLDGDCLDDIVVRGVNRAWAAYGGADRAAFATPGVEALDLAVGDIDGDGEREIAILGSGGRVTLWSP